MIGSNVCIVRAFKDKEGGYRTVALILILLMYIWCVSNEQNKPILTFHLACIVVVLTVFHRPLAMVLARKGRYGVSTLDRDEAFITYMTSWGVDDMREFTLCRGVDGSLVIGGSPCGLPSCSVQHGMTVYGYDLSVARCMSRGNGSITVAVACKKCKDPSITTGRGEVRFHVSEETFGRIQNFFRVQTLGSSGTHTFVGAVHFVAC